MGNLTEEIKRAIAQGDKKVKGFKGAIRSLEVLTIEEGDIFTIPQNYEVYEQKFAGGGIAQYTWVTLENGNAKKFYPGTFTKRRRIYDEDDQPTAEFAVTEGTAAELFRQYTQVEDGMNALVGKKCKVTEIDNVRTLNYTTNQVSTQQIPTIDLV